MTRLFALLLLLGTAACSMREIQTTSGAQFVATANGQIDPDVAAVAMIEPDLHFPARIGIARVVNGQLTLPPAGEMAQLAGATQGGDTYGTFVVVNPHLSELLSTARLPVDAHGRPKRIDNLYRLIQLTAARQHLDYVVIYEVGARSPRTRTPHGLDNLPGTVTTPGARATGIGRAAFLDVRTGYPYAALQVDRDLGDLRQQYGIFNRSDASRQAAALKVTEALAPQITIMLAELAARVR